MSSTSCTGATPTAVEIRSGHEGGIDGASDSGFVPSDAKRDQAVDDGAFEWPPNCDPGPGGVIAESFTTVGGRGERQDCTPDLLSCTTDLRFTPTSSRLFPGNPDTPPSDTIIFEGTFDDGGLASVSVLLDANRYSVTDLVGVYLHSQNSRQTLSCFSETQGNIPGEPYVSATSVLRDASDGDAIITAHGFNVLAPGGTVDYSAGLLPEITLRWVATPEEDCESRRVAFELMVVATGEKVLGHWNRRSTFQMAGRDYVFVASSDRMMAPKGCGWPGNWVLIRDGFLRRKADAG